MYIYKKGDLNMKRNLKKLSRITRRLLIVCFHNVGTAVSFVYSFYFGTKEVLHKDAANTKEGFVSVESDDFLREGHALCPSPSSRPVSGTTND